MTIGSKEERLAQLCRNALAGDGVASRACVMVLFAMADSDLGYWEALGVWADYNTWIAWDPWRWHTEVCSYLLKAGLEVRPELYFKRKKREVRKNENGVSS